MNPATFPQNDQTAVPQRVPDRAAHARRAGDLQVGGGHHPGVPGGDRAERAGERPSEAAAAGRGHRDLARLA